jgi:hypothetical protein
MIPYTESRPIPEHDFDTITPAVEEDEQVSRQRILTHVLPGYHRQSVEAPPHVCGLRRDKYPYSRGPG